MSGASFMPKQGQRLGLQLRQLVKLLWLDTYQCIDLYDQELYVTQAAQATADFLHRKLVS